MLDSETGQRLFGREHHLGQLVEAVVYQVLEAQISEQLQAGPYERTAPAAVAPLERGFDDATAVPALPFHYRTRLRTTNGVERLNEEIRRRERVIRIFPNRDSVVRLLGALLLEQDEAWTTGQRYFDMTTYWHWQRAQEGATV